MNGRLKWIGRQRLTITCYSQIESLEVGMTLSRVGAFSSCSACNQDQGDNEGPVFESETLVTIGLMMEVDKIAGVPHLIVVPGLLDNWKKHLRDFLDTNHPKFPKILKYHGGGRNGRDEENLKDFDIIVTTYKIVKSEQQDYESYRRLMWQHMRPLVESDQEAAQLAAGNVHIRPGHDTTPLLALPREPPKGQWPLANLKFHILTLDGVHEIKTQSTRDFQEIINLHANFVSTVSRSRLNNSYEDMSSICRLIKLSPLNNSQTFDKVSAPCSVLA